MVYRNNDAAIDEVPVWILQATLGILMVILFLMCSSWIEPLHEKNGIQVQGIICSGGISLKNPLLMQIYADVLGKRLKVAESDQAAALGSAIYAALSAGEEKGGYDSYEETVRKMKILFRAKVCPSRPANSLTGCEWECLSAAISECMALFGEKNAITPEEYLETKRQDYATAYSDGRVVFTFRNGVEVSTEI